MWPSEQILDLFQIELPIVQAPMAGSNGAELAASVAASGGLGSLPCAMLSGDEVRTEVAAVRAVTDKPLNLNFFCHRPASVDVKRDAKWRQLLTPYYEEYGLAFAEQGRGGGRKPFDSVMCELVEELKPAVVSFHFGMPSADLVARVANSGCKIMSSATTVAEARWLESQGVDAVIAQGFEAGGHRGMFLTESIASQVGTFALVPQVVDAVSVPVIAAGGIADGRGIVAAFMLGASAVQMGSVYLRCPESRTAPQHRAALNDTADDVTALTNLFTGRPARGIVNRLMREIGPVNPAAPGFPLAAAAIGPLRAAAEARLSGDFSPLWAGQAAAFGSDVPAAKLTQRVISQAQELLRD